MIEQINTAITTYFYPEYAVAVWFFTALIRFLFVGIDWSIHPKWITLVVGIILAVAGYALKIFTGEAFNLFKVISSFGAATLGYDYFWKIFKDKVTGIEFTFSKRKK